MSLKTRAFVFATFFGSCLVVGLLVASLTTEYWVQAQAKRHNSSESEGKINFGLFGGSKHLNVAYGWRLHEINVLSIIRDEPDVINYWLWLGTTFGTGFSILASAISAVSSVIKSASSPSTRKTGTMVVLFVSNFLSGLSQILAFVCWILQFFQHLQHNVLVEADRTNQWYTTNNASLGHSFYFIVAGIVIVTINIILLSCAVKHERRVRTRVFDTPTDEKTQGAIMLY
uniref:Putative conserved plasma membrane protein n=1 Tax=Corethrella appendiculata TaxID=1370023 RepID=U5ER10_9DIPT